MNCVPSGNFVEKHFAPQEVAELLQMSVTWVYRSFRNCPGVLWLGGRKTGKRSYLTLRIPESVLLQWMLEHRSKPAPEIALLIHKKRIS